MEENNINNSKVFLDDKDSILNDPNQPINLKKKKVDVILSLEDFKLEFAFKYVFWVIVFGCLSAFVIDYIFLAFGFGHVVSNPFNQGILGRFIFVIIAYFLVQLILFALTYIIPLKSIFKKRKVNINDFKGVLKYGVMITLWMRIADVVVNFLIEFANGSSALVGVVLASLIGSILPFIVSSIVWVIVINCFKKKNFVTEDVTK